MIKLKRFARWLTHKVSLALLANAVAVAIPLLAFGIHITNPQVMKDWLSSTDTYETLITESLNLIELDATNAETQGSLGDSLSSNPFVNNETIIDALRSTLTPEFIQAQAEDFIDGAYEWLDGETEVPNFRFSLAERNDALAARLSESLKEQYANMPTCLPEEITPEFNLLETLCRPPGVNIDAEVDLLVGELAGDGGLLASATWTGEDLIREEGEESGLSPTQVNFARTSFDGLKNGPTYLVVIGLFAIPLVFYTSRSQYSGYNEVANTLFSGSLFTFVPAIIIARWENIITSLIGNRDEASQSSVDAVRAIFEPFLETAVNDIASLTAWLSGFMVIVSGSMVLYGLYLRRVYAAAEEARAQKEINQMREERVLSEVKRKARKHTKNKDKTIDPKTKKPLKPRNKSITVHRARQIIRDPGTKKKKIIDLEKKKLP